MKKYTGIILLLFLISGVESGCQRSRCPGMSSQVDNIKKRKKKKVNMDLFDKKEKRKYGKKSPPS